MKSLTGKFTSVRGWALLLTLLLGAGMMLSACGDEEVPSPTTPAPTPPPPPAPAPNRPRNRNRNAPEAPAEPVGLRISDSGEDFIEWSWSAVDGVSGYDVHYSENEAFTDEDETIARTAEEISYRRENLEADTSHYVRVRSAAGTGDGRVTSGWSTHVTGMTAAATPPPPPAPVAPAAPTNLEVSDSGEDFIEWTWEQVAGAAGYLAQFSTDSSFAAGDPEFSLAGVANTTHKVANLPADEDGYLRVRAYVGTAAEPTYGDWTEAVSGSTDAPPPAVPLDTPGGLSVTDRDRMKLTLEWNGVLGAATYQVQQRTDDADWSGANCGSASADNQVGRHRVRRERSRRGTEYDFRVRAAPAAEDTATLTVSGWSSRASATTTGRAAVNIEDGGLNLQWKSEGPEITWIWDPVEDRALQPLVDSYVSLLDTDNAECPSFDKAPVTGDFDDNNYQQWVNMTRRLRLPPPSVTVLGKPAVSAWCGPGKTSARSGSSVVSRWCGLRPPPRRPRCLH